MAACQYEEPSLEYDIDQIVQDGSSQDINQDPDQSASNNDSNDESENSVNNVQPEADDSMPSSGITEDDESSAEQESDEIENSEDDELLSDESSDSNELLDLGLFDPDSLLFNVNERVYQTQCIACHQIQHFDEDNTWILIAGNFRITGWLNTLELISYDEIVESENSLLSELLGNGDHPKILDVTTIEYQLLESALAHFEEDELEDGLGDIDSDNDGFLDANDMFPNDGQRFAQQGFLYERWLTDDRNIDRLIASDIFDSTPEFKQIISGDMVSPTNVVSSHVMRMRVVFTPDKTGNYQFYSAADDKARVWLGVFNKGAQNKFSIIDQKKWVSPFNYFKYQDQKSKVFTLVKGEHYYLEMVGVDIGSKNSFSIAWREFTEDDDEDDKKVDVNILSGDFIQAYVP